MRTLFLSLCLTASGAAAGAAGMAPSAWAQMWLLAASIFFACKALSLIGVAAAPFSRFVVYCFAWPGLDAAGFLHTPTRVPRVAEWLRGAASALLGAALLGLAIEALPDDHALLAGWVGMTGLVLLLHFGLFHLLSCLWRTCGRPAPPLMNHPLAATSVADFWGRRWNTAFRDITHRRLFRPLASRWGATAALLVSFLVSGLIHDLVISLPAGAGFGLPTGYFLVQALGVLFERSASGRRLGLGRGWTGRAFALAVIAGPAFLLFHPWFIHNVVLPFLAALGSL